MHTAAGRERAAPLRWARLHAIHVTRLNVTQAGSRECTASTVRRACSTKSSNQSSELNRGADIPLAAAQANTLAEARTSAVVRTDPCRGSAESVILMPVAALGCMLPLHGSQSAHGAVSSPQTTLAVGTTLSIGSANRVRPSARHALHVRLQSSDGALRIIVSTACRGPAGWNTSNMALFTICCRARERLPSNFSETQ